MSRKRTMIATLIVLFLVSGGCCFPTKQACMERHDLIARNPDAETPPGDIIIISPNPPDDQTPTPGNTDPANPLRIWVGDEEQNAGDSMLDLNNLNKFCKLRSDLIGHKVDLFEVVDTNGATWPVNGVVLVHAYPDSTTTFRHELQLEISKTASDTLSWIVIYHQGTNKTTCTLSPIPYDPQDTSSPDFREVPLELLNFTLGEMRMKGNSGVQPFSLRFQVHDWAKI